MFKEENCYNNNCFQLPIEFLNNKQELSNNLIDDLELTETIHEGMSNKNSELFMDFYLNDFVSIEYNSKGHVHKENVSIFGFLASL